MRKFFLILVYNLFIVGKSQKDVRNQSDVSVKAGENIRDADHAFEISISNSAYYNDSVRFVKNDLKN